MPRQIPKPAADIPDSDWNSLSYEDQAYAEFIYEIFDYFDEIVKGKLGWIPENVRINQGKNNVVLGFDHANQSYLFRVPKYGTHQLKSYMRAARRLEHLPFFPKRHYIDENCMIESFAPGQTLDKDAPAAAYSALAKALNQLHTLPAKGFGRLVSLTEGDDESAEAHYLPLMLERIDLVKSVLPEQTDVIDRLLSLWTDKLHSISEPLILCHGDLWSNNVLFEVESDTLTIVDWDSCGVYHREKDLHFLLSDDVPDAYRKQFFDAYDFDVDVSLMSWYRVTMNVIYFKPERLDHLVTAVNHFFNLMGRQEVLSYQSTEGIE